jgi:superfamily II DNA or RNA helicase
MIVIKREPGKGYIDRWLWLPRSEVSQNQIQNALLYRVGDKTVRAWKETPSHFQVPRNYIREELRAKLSFPLIDARVLTFPKIKIKSSIVLDSQRPDLSFQTEGVAALQSCYDGILQLRCGGGKSPVVLHAAAALKGPILIVVDELGLAEQWRRTIRRFITTGDPVIGEVGDGKKDWKHDITVASVRTIAKMVQAGEITPEMSRHFAVVVYDEVQVMGAPVVNLAVGAFHGRRWGCSATPERDDSFNSLLRFGLGRVIYTYLMPESKPNFYFLRLPTSPLNAVQKQVVYARGGKFHFGLAYSVLAEDVRRTALIVHEINLALSRGRQVLVLSSSKKMCKMLKAALPQAGLVTGDVSGKLRIERIQTCNPVVAVMKVGEKALDKPNLDTVFIVDPVSKQRRLQQILGRVLRIYEGKPPPTVVAFEDYNIKELRRACSRMRSTLNQWPEDQGGAIGHRTLTPGHEKKNGKPPSTRSPRHQI